MVFNTPRFRPLRLLLVAASLALLAAACSGSAETATVSSPDPPTTPAAGEADPSSPADSSAAGSADEPYTGESYAGTQPAPEFPSGLDWLNTDSPLTFSALRGKVVLLDFWTYGCINCIHIIPDLERLEREYPDELVVIGVHSAKFSQEAATENIRQVVLRYGLAHPVVNDHDFEIWRTWGARGWPTVVVVDPAGNVVGGHSGEGVYPLVQPVIEALVQEFDAKGLLDRTPIEHRLEADGLPRTVLSFPGKVHADPEDDRLFIADTNHNRVVQARISTGEVVAVYGSGRSGFDDGSSISATFRQPQGLALRDESTLYVADTGNHAVRSIDLATGEVATVAGTGRRGGTRPQGFAPNVDLASPWDLLLDGETLYIAMAGTHQIWTIDLASAEVAVFAGNGRESTQNGPRLDAELAQPSGLALADGRLYFADSESSSIRYAETARDGEVSLLVGADAGLFDFGDADGTGNEARLQHPLGVSFWEGSLYVADTYNSKIKRVDPAAGEITTFLGGDAGWRDGAEPLFYEPGGLHVVEGIAYVADTNNHAVRIVDIDAGSTRTLILAGIERFAAPAGDDDYQGALVALAPVEVGAGPGSLIVDIQLPDGYKVNEDAPSSLVWSSDGAGVTLPDEEIDITGTVFPVEVPATFAAGDTTLRGDVTLIWCRSDAEGLCFIEQVRFTVAVTAGASGPDRIVFPHSIRLPEGEA